MNAWRMSGSRADGRRLAADYALRRQPERSQVKTPAQAHGQTPPTVMQAKTTGARTPLARCYSALARTHHRWTPEVKARIQSAHDVRGSRACTGCRTPTNLLNSHEGHNMEKTARSFISPPTKSFPVNGLRTYSENNEAKPRNPMTLRSYTLCEYVRLLRAQTETRHPASPHFLSLWNASYSPTKVAAGSCRLTASSICLS